MAVIPNEPSHVAAGFLLTAAVAVITLTILWKTRAALAPALYWVLHLSLKLHRRLCRPQVASGAAESGSKQRAEHPAIQRTKKDASVSSGESETANGSTTLQEPGWRPAAFFFQLQPRWAPPTQPPAMTQRAWQVLASKAKVVWFKEISTVEVSLGGFTCSIQRPTSLQC
ncbi:hypothetical protein WJX77_006952 [Trebouxia sp. C0004]